VLRSFALYAGYPQSLLRHQAGLHGRGSDPAPDFPTWGTTMVSTAELLAPCSDRYMPLIDKLPSLIIGTSERILSYFGVVLERLISYFQHLSTMYVNNKVKALTIRYEHP